MATNLSLSRSALVSFLGMVALGFASGCAAGADEAPPGDGTTKPHLLALSTYSASLGTPIDGFIANPPAVSARTIELVFEGVFTHSDGRVEPVSMTQPTTRTEAGAVRWTTFGPFVHPFAPKDPDVGVFTGKVGIKVTDADGTSTMDERPLPVSFEVKPSIMVTELQPTTADCGKPALRLIGAMSYKIKARVIGFKPTSMEYAFETPDVVPDGAGLPALGVGADGNPQYRTTKLAHAIAGPDATDVVDGNDVLVLPPVPADRPSYGVLFGIVARDDAGHTVTSGFGMTAHKPLEVFYDGRFELSQIYAPTPVSSCMPGGQQGRTVNYTEAQTETRQRQLSLTISSSWLKSDENNWSTSDGTTVTQSKTQTNGFSRLHGTSNTFSFEKSHSDSKGVSFNWSDAKTHSSGWTGGGNAGVSFKPFGVGAELGAKGEYRNDNSSTQTNGGGSSSGSTDGWTQGTSNGTVDQTTIDSSTATTDSSAVTKTNTKGGSNKQENGGGRAAENTWTVSSSQTIERGFTASVIANTYGVFYRQMARYTQRAFVLEYNKCGEGELLGDLTMQDYIWAPDLALSPQCPPLPESNFPKPQCYLPPCDP